jgi:anaerobic carbon-monoxide dehydrogenase iron sulfur subunit
MAKKILVIDSEKCTGCRKCEQVCSVFHTGTYDPLRSRMKVLKWDHIGYYLPVSCQNCDEAACAEVCPSRACKRNPELDVTTIDRKICIGCKSCVLACPFGVPTFDKTEGISIKCDYCDGDPQCVAYCEAGALSFIEPQDISAMKVGDLAHRMMALQTAR